MPLPFDATLKDVVASHPLDFVAAFGMPTDLPAATLNVDLSTISAATDVVFGFGDPVREIVDLNFQSGPDPALAARLLVYSSLLHLRHCVPVQSVVVLLRPKADTSNLSGILAYDCGGIGVEFRYKVVRMWQQPVEPFLEGGVGLLPLAMLCQLPPEMDEMTAMSEVIRRIENRLYTDAAPAEAAQLMRASMALAGLRVQPADWTTFLGGDPNMAEVMTMWDVWEEKARQATIRALISAATPRVGEIDATSTSALQEVQDPDRLDRMLRSIWKAKNWEEILQTP